jgi:hypothetical protein
MNYKAHYDLSWYRPLCGGNSPMSSGLILKINIGYNGGEQRAQEVHVVKGEMISYLCLKGRGPFTDCRSGRLTMN